MSFSESYRSKFTTISEQTSFRHLPEEQRSFLRQQACRYRFTLQDLRKLADIALDLNMWGEGSIIDLWPLSSGGDNGRNEKKRVLGKVAAIWEGKRAEINRYRHRNDACIAGNPTAEAVLQTKAGLGLGSCPVASPRTRCCNLMTLDAVDNCGYGCSYCSIQSFFGDNRVFFDDRFGDKLAALELDPQQVYHIGTGQSSDSLMWGNSHGVLDALIGFAHKHPNVILELKTKAANIAHLLQTDLPRNILCTWSLNTPTIIRNEERGTVSLEKRLTAARTLADKGVIVGFHFHPLIHYRGWREDYAGVVDSIQSTFNPSEVALISLGTLTYTKTVLRKIRESQLRSKVLKMELTESDGKFSYPEKIKLELFSHLYNSFDNTWHKGTFFYLCMENNKYWKPVFGFEYSSNDEFEKAMKESYSGKINQS
jgi:spore photoproduct lyase